MPDQAAPGVERTVQQDDAQQTRPDDGGAGKNAWFNRSKWNEAAAEHRGRFVPREQSLAQLIKAAIGSVERLLQPLTSGHVNPGPPGTS